MAVDRGVNTDNANLYRQQLFVLNRTNFFHIQNDQKICDRPNLAAGRHACV